MLITTTNLAYPRDQGHGNRFCSRFSSTFDWKPVSCIFSFGFESCNDCFKRCWKEQNNGSFPPVD